ncbi:DNA polymerase, partial [Trichonephila clavipes]
MVLSFLVERANFTAWNAVQALHMGNSSFLLELFKTYGTCLGYFVNTHFLKSPVDIKKYASVLVTKNQTYQGALNYCIPEKAYENVSVMDFASMYPSALLSSNLCYGTCTIMTREEWLACPPAQQLTNIAYRVHGERDFENDTFGESPVFHYPPFNPEKDAFAIVINEQTEAFLPHIVKHFIDLRKHHQGEYKQTKDVYHYNAQLCIKILINSLYGVMANKDSCLAYLPIAMTIVTLARFQLLGSYHYLKRLNYHICYADTDSLMVQHWPDNDCHAVNAYLNLNHVELKFEQRMKRLLVLSRKRYIYETQKGKIVTKGFQKRINELIEFISQLVLENVWHFVFSTPLEKDSFAWMEDHLSLSSRGWILWVYIIQEAHYKCRDAKKYSIYRKTKHLSDYKSKSCVAVHVLQKYPEKANDFIEYTYSRADVAQREASKWVMDAQECQWVNYEQLFISQKKMFCMLLNMAFWKLPKVPLDMCDMVLNTQRWKQFVQAELLFWHKTRAQGEPRKLLMLVEKGIKYTFSMNNHVKRNRGRNVRGPPRK